MRKNIIVYDADCGPCSSFKQIIGFLDTKRSFEFMGLVEADSTGVLDGVPPPLRHRSFHLVGLDGTILSGARAIPTLVSLLHGGRLPSEFVVSAPGGIRAVGFIYGVFSRLHGTGSCRDRPSLWPHGGSGLTDSTGSLPSLAP